jgi:hypothetical protein
MFLFILAPHCQKSKSPPTAPVVPADATLSAVSGTVSDADKPVAGAVVRIRATENKTTTASDGFFVLAVPDGPDTLTVTAWKEGYLIGWIRAVPGADSLAVSIREHYVTDNPEYGWFSFEGVTGSASCAKCMASYDEWISDAHSQSAVNPRFLSMYNGTDLSGNRNPAGRDAMDRDGGHRPLRLDPPTPDSGPGYKLDFPNLAGNCVACHVPGMAAKPGMESAADPNLAQGVDKEGVHCEFCHKIGAVNLDPSTGMPHPGMPGVLSYRLYRPPDPGKQVFFGNFDDVTRRVTYLPLMERSEYCAGCHFGEFWGTVVYNSFGEWLDSPYSDPESGKTCQACHMPTVNYEFFAFPERGGVRRDPSRIFSHRMPGAMDETFLRNAVTMRVHTSLNRGKVGVLVSITNDKTGHHAPTDSPLRHMILTVVATDAQGDTLRPIH